MFTGKKSTSSFTFSLRYWGDFANLLFWILWTWPAIQNQSDTIWLKKTFVSICFCGDIAKICKLWAFLDTLCKPGCAHLKWWYQLVENFYVCLHAKNKLHRSLLSWNIYILKNPEISLAESILAHYLKTRNLPAMGLVLKYQ